jgi:hypothetical protein
VKEVVLDCVLTEFELRRNLAVGETLGNQFRHLALARRKWNCGFVRQEQRRDTRENLEHRFDLLTGCPRLARVHVLNAPAQSRKRIISRKDSFGSGTKSIDDRRTIRRVEEKDGANLGMQVAQPAHSLKTSQGTILKIGPDQCDAGLMEFCRRKNLFRAGGPSYDFDTSTPPKSPNQKLTVHEILVGYNQADIGVSTLWTGLPGHTPPQNALKTCSLGHLGLKGGTISAVTGLVNAEAVIVASTG